MIELKISKTQTQKFEVQLRQNTQHAYLNSPPGGEYAKHMRSGYLGLKRIDKMVATPAPRL